MTICRADTISNYRFTYSASLRALASSAGNPSSWDSLSPLSVIPLSVISGIRKTKGGACGGSYADAASSKTYYNGLPV